MKRRRFLGLAGGVGLAMAVAGCGGANSTGELLTTRRPLPPMFRVRLPVPAVKRPLRTDYYEVTQRFADVEILPGTRTRIMGYDGVFPGPTIESRRGRPITVRHRNQLDVPTVVHLHGGHTPADSDGYPTDLLIPEQGWDHTHHKGMRMSGDLRRGTRDYVYPGDQPAATLWYHDHRMDYTGPQVYRGLAGFHIVRDDVEDNLPLPTGERDIPLMVTDRSFGADGELLYPARRDGGPGVEDDYMEGVLGDVVLVNGAPWPQLDVAGARYRFRLLNASNARRWSLALDPPPPDGDPFVQIGSDAGLLAAPVGQKTIDMAPAERFDVIVDFGRYPQGTTVELRNLFGRGSTAKVMRFRVGGRVRDASRVPSRLSTVEPLRPGGVRRSFRFSRGAVDDGHAGWLINARPFVPDRIDATVPLGAVETWRLSTDLHHPVHIHLSPFQVLRRGNGGPGAFDGGWKDTVDIRPAETVDVAVRFTDYAGTFMLHCHNLEHEDMAMMTNFATR